MKYLGPDYPIYGVQARSLARLEPRSTSIDQMAADYIDQIRTVQPVGPYCLLGWSFGGLVAHAAATELQQRGEQVALLANLDSYPFRIPREGLPVSEREILIRILELLECDAGSPEDHPVTLARVMEILRNSGHALASIDEYHVSAITEIFANNVDLAINFTPGVFHGDLLLFAATIDQPEDMPTPDAWAPYINGSIETYHISSPHDRMMRPESLSQIGPILAAKLREITDIASPTHREP
jgi:thioesterase domain-containing protein